MNFALTTVEEFNWNYDSTYDPTDDLNTINKDLHNINNLFKSDLRRIW